MDKGITQVLAEMAQRPGGSAELDRLRREITVLFSDLQGSTAYFERYGDGAGLALVYRCIELQRAIIGTAGGRVIKTMGDGLMAAFGDPLAALRAAVKIQQALARANAGQQAQHQAQLRIGLNCGLGIVKSDDVFGDVVNVASRVQTAAAPSQIAVSRELYARAPKGGEFRFVHAGKRSFKGKSEEQDVYLLEWSGPASTILSAPKIGMPLFLQHIQEDGSPGRQIPLSATPLVIGSGPSDMSFPTDPNLRPQHARLGSGGDGCAWVEPAGENAPIFVGLKDVCPLKNGDIIRMGQQSFRYEETEGAMAAASDTGMTLVELNSALKRPAAELINLSNPGQRIAVGEEETTFGRVQGTCTFPQDGYMSRRHARIYHRGIDVFLEDLGSRNGTFVQMTGRRAAVQPGGKLRVGNQLFQIVATQ